MDEQGPFHLTGLLGDALPRELLWGWRGSSDSRFCLTRMNPEFGTYHPAPVTGTRWFVQIHFGGWVKPIYETHGTLDDVLARFVEWRLTDREA